ncbi:MAG: DUF5399 family protein [Verrucomicrobiota bacterium]|nr:DUF5399 family protein [Verrucomicrobiota bacterium]
MSVKPRTIDNLGIDSSIRYAKDKQLLDPRLIEESKWIPQKTEISVTRPFVPSEFDQLFSFVRTVQWALFASPPNYEAQARALFSYQLIPSLGTYEKQEADNDKLAAIEDALKKRREQRKKQQDDREEQEEEKERQILAALFQCIEKLDRTLTLINAKRNQYQRG